MPNPKARYFINTPDFVIGISDIPDVKIRIPVISDSDEVKKDKKALPVKLNERVVYYISDRKDHKFYKITAYKDEGFDGATIKFYSWLIGYPLQPEFLTGAILHDKICRDHSLLDYKRRLSSELFYELLILTCTPKIKALIIREVVDLFQRFVYLKETICQRLSVVWELITPIKSKRGKYGLKNNPNSSPGCASDCHSVHQKAH